MDTGEYTSKLICNEQDFNAAISMTDVFIKHASYIFNHLPETSKTVKKPNKKERFYAELPEIFNRKTYLDVAQKLGILDKTAQAYIAAFKTDKLIHHDGKDSYLKQ